MHAASHNLVIIMSLRQIQCYWELVSNYLLVRQLVTYSPALTISFHVQMSISLSLVQKCEQYKLGNYDVKWNFIRDALMKHDR